MLMASIQKNGNYAFHNAQLPHRTYIEMKNYQYEHRNKLLDVYDYKDRNLILILQTFPYIFLHVFYFSPLNILSVN